MQSYAFVTPVVHDLEVLSGNARTSTLETFQMKAILPRYEKKVKSRKGKVLRRIYSSASFSKTSRARQSQLCVSRLIAQSVFPPKPALQTTFTFALDPASLAYDRINPQPIAGALVSPVLFGLLSVIIYSKWDSQSIYHCHHVTAAKPPFSPQNRSFLASVSLSRQATFQVACCFSVFSGLCVGYEQKFQDRKIK